MTKTRSDETYTHLRTWRRRHPPGHRGTPGRLPAQRLLRTSTHAHNIQTMHPYINTLFKQLFYVIEFDFRKLLEQESLNSEL